MPTAGAAVVAVVTDAPAPARPSLLQPLTLRGTTLPNRLAVAPMCQYSVTDGLVGDYHLVHLGRFALGGFGLVMVEALACGTPVVALRGGAVSEVVEHGRSGLVGGSPEELPELLKQVTGISPAACRERARRFDVAAMVAGYEGLYAAAALGALSPQAATERVRAVR